APRTSIRRSRIGRARSTRRLITRIRCDPASRSRISAWRSTIERGWCLRTIRRRRIFSRRAKSWRAMSWATVISRESAWRSARPSGGSPARRRRAMSVGEDRDDLDQPLPLLDLIAEAQRVLAICNACRYCEGYCAVFPALKRRLSFAERDVHYLANLCHNFGACFYACQSAPPHEFHLNLPRVLAKVRNRTYRQYAWPAFLAAAFERNGATLAAAMALSIVVLLAFTAWFGSSARFVAAFSDAQGSFYALLPHGVMSAVFGAVFAIVVLALGISLARFRASMREAADGASLIQAARDAATLKYLNG